jgi:hypothetical protein
MGSVYYINNEYRMTGFTIVPMTVLKAVRLFWDRIKSKYSWNGGSI